MRVLVREPIAEPGLELLRSHFDVDVDEESPLEEIIDRYDAIVIRSATRLTADLIARADAAEGDRARRGGDRQRRRRRRHPPRHRRRQRAGVDGHLGGRADDRPAGRAGAQHPAGARGAQGGSLGARALERGRARRQDARHRRLRPHRPAGRAARGRARACASSPTTRSSATTASATSVWSARRRSTPCWRARTSSRSTPRSTTRPAASSTGRRSRRCATAHGS